MLENVLEMNLPFHILDGLRDPVVVAYPEGTVHAMNRAALELLGYTAAEVAGQPVKKFLTDEAFFHGAGLARLMSEGAAREVETTLITRAGKYVPVVFDASVVRDGDGQLAAVVGVAHDVRSTGAAEARAAEAHVLRTVAEALNRAAGLQEALDRSLEAVMGLIGSEAGWISLLEEVGGVRLVAARHLPPALEADDRAAMRGSCQCLELLRSGQLPAAANIVECERLRTARGDTRGLRHHATVPIRAAGRDASTGPVRNLGNLNLTMPADRVFTESELNLLTAVGDQIGVAVERTQLCEAERQRTAELARSNALITALGRVAALIEITPDPIRVMETLGAELKPLELNCLIAELTPDEGNLTIEYLSIESSALAVAERLTGLTLRRFRMPAGLLRRICTNVIGKKNALFVSDPMPAARVVLPGLPKPILERVLRLAGMGPDVRAIYLPLMIKERVLGVLGIWGQSLQEGDTLAVSIFAGQLVATLEVARLYEQVKAHHIEEQAVLLRLSQALLNATETQAVMDQAIAVVAEAVRPDLCKILLLGETGDHLRLCAGRGWQAGLMGQAVVPTGVDSQAGYTLMARRPVVVEDFAHETRFRPPQLLIDHGVVSGMSTPMLVGERAIGVLGVHWRCPRPGTEDETRLLALIANATAQALERVRLFAETQRRVEEQATLLKLSQALLGETEAQAVMDMAVRVTAEALKVEFVTMALMEADGASVSARASLGWPPELFPQLQHIPIAATTALAHALRTRAPVIIPDESRETRFGAPPWVTQMGFASSLLAPMLATGQAIGGLVVNSRTARHWSDDETRLLSLIAHTTAQALERIRLFEALAAEKQRLELLYDLSQSLTASLDPREVANRALALTTSALGVFKGEMFVLDPDKDRLHVVAMSGYEAESVEALDRELNLHVGQGLAGSAALARAPHIAPDVAHDEHWLPVPGVDDWVRSAAAIPLLAGDELVGVLNLFSDREGFFHARDLPLLTAVTVPMALALQKARLFEIEREQRELAEALRDALGAGAALSATLNFDSVLDRLLEQIARVVPYDTANVMLLDAPMGRIHVARQRGYGQFDEQVVQDIAALSLDIASTANLRWMAETGQPLVIPDTAADPDWVTVEASAHVRSWAGAPIVVNRQVIAFFSLDKIEPNFYRPEHGERLAAFAGQAALALQNARLFEETRRRAEELESLAQVSSALRQAPTRATMLPLLVETTMRLLRADAGALLLLDVPGEPEALVVAAAHGPGAALVGQRHPPGHTPLWQIVRTGQALVVSDVTEQVEFSQCDLCRALMEGLLACACVPLKTTETTIGLLHLASRSKRAATEGEIRLLTSIAEMAGNALHRATLHEQTAQRLQRLTILRAIDVAISASLDLHLVLNVLLDQITAQLHLDAADVLMLDPHSQMLEYAVGRGFRGSAVTHTHVRLGEGHAGRAVLERRIVHATNLPRTRPAGRRTQELTGEEAFVTYYAVPLIAKGEVKGVLEIFHRTALSPDPEWLEFLEALAVQAAIAIDNAALFDGLQRSNSELALAYDTTIEGWSKALDLRDKETEGHSQRVTDLTLRLAWALGISDAELVHIRRGALLHDIGKMGVPDSILLKHGPLTADEREIMRRHPQHAYDMLSPIAFLRRALDIPYCHHEKWDGTGYPRGLKGEQIPLAARIFAVVDVWDALRSDRPYRAAWPEEKVRRYIREQAGQYFDPKIVEMLVQAGFRVTGRGRPGA